MDTQTLKNSFYKFLLCISYWLFTLVMYYDSNVTSISFSMILLFLISCRYLFIAAIGFCYIRLEKIIVGMDRIFRLA